MRYTIKRPAPPQPTPTNSRGTRGAAAKQRKQEQQPDNSEVVSFVTQLREYNKEQEELVAALLQAAGVDSKAAVMLKQEQASNGAVGSEQHCTNGVNDGAAAAAPAAADVKVDGGSDLAEESGLPNKRSRQE